MAPVYIFAFTPEKWSGIKGGTVRLPTKTGGTSRRLKHGFCSQTHNGTKAKTHDTVIYYSVPLFE